MQFAKVSITVTDGNRNNSDTAVTLTRTAFPAAAQPVLCAQGVGHIPANPTKEYINIYL